jgi:Mrp family chromosome partitioning ATPase
MSIITISSPKGGQGVSTVAALIALTSSKSRRTLLVDTSTDQAVILALDLKPLRPGIAEMLMGDRHTDARCEHVTKSLQFLPRGSGTIDYTSDQFDRLRNFASALECDTVILDLCREATNWQSHADLSILIIRPSYLATRAALAARKPTHLVVIDEPSPTLTASDVERALQLTSTVIPYSLEIAAFIDAGVLNGKLPCALSRPLLLLDRVLQRFNSPSFDSLAS